MCILGVIRTDLRLRWVRIDPTSGRSWCRELFCRWRKCVVNCTIIIFDHICVKLRSMHNDDVNAISLRRSQSTRDASSHCNGLTMSTHITKVVASLRQLRSIRRSLSHESFIRLVVALVLARLDYCKGVLAGLPASQLSRLQSVLHVAARLIYSVRRYDHVTPLLQQLHWLSVPERVTFKLCVMAYRCLHGIGPEYI